VVPLLSSTELREMEGGGKGRRREEGGGRYTFIRSKL
jgi:hypothetical protein